MERPAGLGTWTSCAREPSCTPPRTTSTPPWATSSATRCARCWTEWPKGSRSSTPAGLVYPDTQGVTVDEEHPVDPGSSQPFKIHGERQVLDAGHVAGTVIRAGLVYGRGGSGLLQGMLASARQQGMVAYISEGTNEWSSVHVDDLAALYASVLARRSPGTVVNAAAPEPTPMRRIVEAVAATAGARAVSVTLEQAAEMMGPAAAVLTRWAPLDSSKARRLFGWKPTSPSLLGELTTGSYARTMV